MEIRTAPDCGNSPKKILIRQLTVDFASYEVEKVKDYFADDIEWRLIGDKSIKGKEEFAEALEQMSNHKVSDLTIHSIITHGREASVNGEMVMGNNDRFAFADFYKFTSAASSKIEIITSYVIKVN